MRLEEQAVHTLGRAHVRLCEMVDELIALENSDGLATEKADVIAKGVVEAAALISDAKLLMQKIHPEGQPAMGSSTSSTVCSSDSSSRRGLPLGVNLCGIVAYADVGSAKIDVFIDNGDGSATYLGALGVAGSPSKERALMLAVARAQRKENGS